MNANRNGRKKTFFKSGPAVFFPLIRAHLRAFAASYLPFETLSPALGVKTSSLRSCFPAFLIKLSSLFHGFLLFAVGDRPAGPE
jgi:hypothetical protein